MFQVTWIAGRILNEFFFFWYGIFLHTCIAVAAPPCAPSSLPFSPSPPPHHLSAMSQTGKIACQWEASPSRPNRVPILRPPYTPRYHTSLTTSKGFRGFLICPTWCRQTPVSHSIEFLSRLSTLSPHPTYPNPRSNDPFLFVWKFRPKVSFREGNVYTDIYIYTYIYVYTYSIQYLFSFKIECNLIVQTISELNFIQLRYLIIN